MDNTDRKIMWIIIVAVFLLKTSRVLQATKLCQECLILINNTAQDKTVKVANASINLVLFNAYYLLDNHASAINCGRKVLSFLRAFGLRAKEGKITFELAKVYQRQSKYKEAKELY